MKRLHSKTNVQLIEEHSEKVMKLANKIARISGYLRATEVLYGGKKTKVKSHVDYGYRRISDGVRVSHTYVNNHFGWKNCYYSPAETVVVINKHDFEKCGVKLVTA